MWFSDVPVDKVVVEAKVKDEGLELCLELEPSVSGLALAGLKHMR
jgi:hypothetical protein